MRHFAYVPLVLMVASLAFSQEIDYGSGARRSPLTIFDEIDDRAEREAFRTVWNADEPRIKRERADAFVARYPRSIVLREAYELSARASVEIGDYSGALERARRSLRLLPENPFLLVMTADIAAKQSQLDHADQDAREALRYLANADAPPGLSAADWPRVRDELRATAYFVLGRVAATRGAHADARRSLLMALSLNHEDIEALYTLGVVQMALQDDANAAASFAHVLNHEGAKADQEDTTARRDTTTRSENANANHEDTKTRSQDTAARRPDAKDREDTKTRGGGTQTRTNEGPLARPAREALITLYARRSPNGLSFDQYVSSLRWTPPAPPARAASPPAGAYAGTNACRDCHAPVYERWQSTGMAKMFRAYRPGDVIGDFSSGQTIADRARPLVQDGRHFIEIREGESPRWNRYPVDYVIGSKWQQAYATRLPDSRILVFPIQYSRNRSSWLNYWGIVDAPGSERADISRFHTIPEGAIYQTSCAPCHTSQLRFSEGMEKAASGHFREGGINCEMCHGPSQAHIERIKSGGGARRATLDTPISFSRLPAQQYVAVCSQCHAQSAVHNAGAGGNVNYSDEMPFYRAYPAHLPSNFSRKAFFRDGRYRATTFISEAFSRSQCFRKGEATCGSCHDPHPPDAAGNPTSLKFRDNPDRMCVQCHTAIGEHPERHTRHAAGTEASRCVSCHMPRIMDALLFPARSHEIDEVPDVEMTERFGNADSPNACLMCHTDRDAKWLKEKMTELF